jgi:hypothetical protein
MNLRRRIAVPGAPIARGNHARIGFCGTLAAFSDRFQARALTIRPKLILLDEPSLGLAPQLVEEVFEIVVQQADATTGSAPPVHLGGQCYLTL